jgi:hypothetical protein
MKRRISNQTATSRQSVTASLLAASAALFTLCPAATQMQAQAKQVYRDPSGAYSVNVPAGWQAQPQAGSPMVSIVDPKTKVSVTLGVMRGPETSTPSAESQLQGLEKQFPQSCPQAKIEQRGATKLAGIDGSFLVVHCGGADGPRLMKFTAATKPGVVAMMVSNSPGEAYLKVLLPLESIRSSFKALPAPGTMGAGAPIGGMGNGRAAIGGRPPMQGAGGGQAPMPPMNPAPQGQPQGQFSAQATSQPNGDFPSPGGADSGGYHDPQGRYSLAVPSGWNTASDNGNLTLSSGASFVTVATSTGAKPADVSHQLVQQIQAQYKDFKLLNEGDFQNNGHAAHGTNATGINPKGVRASVLVVSIDAGSGHYLVLISSAPNDQAKQINSTVMQIAQSVRFAGE